MYDYFDGDTTNDYFEIFSQEILDTGIYQVVLSATLDDTYYPTVTTNTQNTWQLELVDPCLSTDINTNLPAADVTTFITL